MCAGVDETIIEEAYTGEPIIADTEGGAIEDPISHEWDPRTPRFAAKSCTITIDENEQQTDPFDIFMTVSQLDKLIDEVILPQTECYARQIGIAFETTAEEIKAFLGISILMGLVKLPSMRDNWTTDPELSAPFSSNIMTRARFELIRRCLHFVDNNLPHNDDRAYKVRSLFNHWNASFGSSRVQSKAQSIDEHMVTFKGHNLMKQYMKRTGWSVL